jgi:hypothetical protein
MTNPRQIAWGYASGPSRPWLPLAYGEGLGVRFCAASVRTALFQVERHVLEVDHRVNVLDADVLGHGQC